MNRHLVPVKVGVKGRTHQRVQLNGFPLDQHGFKGLNPQTVQRGGAVQQNGVFADDFFQNVPNFGALFFHNALGLLDGAGQTVQVHTGINKGLKQLQRHFFGQATLVQFQLWPHNNHGTTGIVDTFPQQVLTETALFPF